MPEPKHLEKFLTEYCLLWRAIGLNLGLKSALLNMIEADHHQHRKCFSKMLEKWLQMDPRATWSTLELAITNANRQNLGYDSLERSKIQNYSYQYYGLYLYSNLYMATCILQLLLLMYR